MINRILEKNKQKKSNKENLEINYYQWFKIERLINMVCIYIYRNIFLKFSIHK